MGLSITRARGALSHLTPAGWLASAGGLAIAAALALLVLGKLGFHFDPFNLTARKVERLQGQVDQKTGELAAAQGQARAGEAAGRIFEREISRTETTRIIHEENDHALRAAPGADAPLDPVYVDTVNRGLCRYASTPAAACAELRPPDP